MKNSKKRGISRPALALTRGALVAAMYVALTWLSSIMGLSSGVIQFRFSEALCILPVFMPEAIPGLFVGCLISNLIATANPWDILFGSLATLIGAVGTFLLRRLPKGLAWLASLPPVLSNMIIVPPVLIFAYGAEDAYWFLLLTVGIGELVCAGFGGSTLYYALRRTRLFDIGMKKNK